MSGTFDDILTANAEWAESVDHPKLAAVAARGLAVLTCMDSRIDPLGTLGLKPGDAKILRNAGARVTNDVQRTLVLAHYLLGVNRVLVMPHTGCRMAQGDESAVHRAVRDAGGPDTRSMAFLTSPDQEEALCSDVQRLRSAPFLADLQIGGFILDLATGLLREVC